MSSSSTIRCLISIGLINYAIAQYFMPVILDAQEAIDFGKKIKNVAITGNLDGTARPEEMGYCSKSRSYVDSLLLILGEHLLEVNPVLQNTQVIASGKIDAWPAVEKLDSSLDDERSKKYKSTATIFAEYNKLLDILAKDVNNYLPGFSNQDMNADAVCSYSKKEVASSAGGDGTLNDDFIPSAEYIHRIVEEHKTHGATTCGRGSSSQTYLYGLYIQTLVAHLKIFIVRLFSYYSLDKYNGVVNACAYTAAHDIETTASDLFATLERGIAETTHIFLRYIPEASDHFRSCDGTHFKEYTTHLELDGAIQGFAFIASRKQGDLRCTGLPSLLHKNSKYYKPYNTDSSGAEYPKPCLGELSDCIDLYIVAKSDNLAICMELYGKKRFSWLVHDDGHNYGPCDKRNFQLLQKFSRDKHNACYCVCSDEDAESGTTHIVSLQEVEADVEENMVVTGVRFTKKRGVLYLQIQQGVLLENGEVEDLEWKPVKDISNDVYESRTGSADRNDATSLEEGRDFYVIRKGKSNYLNLGGVKADDGYVLTGVQFVKNGDRFEVAILTRKFDYRTGKLDLSATRQLKKIPNDNRAGWNGSNGKATNWAAPLIPKANYDLDYIIFEASDTYDGYGQSTVPYFDYLPVETLPPSPVAGVDVLIKTRDNFAGIISLQLKSLAYVQYIKNV